MKHITSKKAISIIEKYAFLMPALLLLAFTIFKAYFSSFTIDESSSYIFYARDTYKNIVECVRLEANNHILNSILMKFFSSWLPLSEFTLRLPSLLAYVIYLIATWFLVRGFKNIWFRLAVFLFLNLNPFVLDFFSLARGYGQSWGLMVLSLYFLKRFMDDQPGNKFIHIFLCFIAAGLSVIASFPTLDYYLALLEVYILYDTWRTMMHWKDVRQRRHFFIRVGIILALTAGMLSYVLKISYKLFDAKYLYFGGNVGFWSDTVNSVVVSWLYGAPYADNGILVLQLFILAIILGSAAALVYLFFFDRRKHPDYDFFVALATILFFIVAGITVQHYLLGVKFIVERTAGYVLVIFMLVAVYLFNYITISRFRAVAAFLIASIPLFHFVETYSFSSVYDWKFDACTKEMMKDLGSLHQKQKPAPASFVFFHPFWLNATASMFYQDLFRYYWMLPVECTNTITHSEDYYYLPDDSLHLLTGYKYRVVKEYPYVHESLVQNLNKNQGTSYGDRSVNLYDSVQNNHEIQASFPVADINNVKCIKLDTGAFSPFIRFDANILRNRSDIYILASARVCFPVLKNGVFIIAVYNKAGKILRWDSVDFGSYALAQTGWMLFPFRLKIDKKYPDADHIRVFIWNTGKKPIYASEISASMRSF